MNIEEAKVQYESVKAAKRFSRKAMAALEEQLACMRRAEITIRHLFAGGVYAREMHAPAGTMAVGKIIKVDNIANISQGEVTIRTDEGLVRLKAPCQWVAPAGTKRAAYFHSDTVWTVYHATPHTDPELVEKDVVAVSYDDPELIERELARLLGEIK